jgi:putative chitinase
MKVTVAQLTKIAGGTPNKANVTSVVLALDRYGAGVGLDLPHRLAHYLAQLGHESGNYKYDEEIASGAAYEGRKDLGNTQPGDGKRFKGRAGIQMTGRANYREFTKWVRKNIDANAPDFEASPELVNTDPWEGLVPIWYWSTRKLNKLADENDLETITLRINGGKNGLSDRIAKYVRAALVLAGYGPTDVLAFQTWAQQQGLLPQGKDQLDGDPGPKTRSALHMALAKERPAIASPAATPMPEVKAAPVVEETTVAVAPKAAEKTLWSRLNGGVAFLGTPFLMFWEADLYTKLAVGVVVLAAIGFLLFKGEMIAARVKSVLKAFDENEVVR